MLKLKIKYSNTYIKKLYKEIVVVFNYFGHFDWFGLNLVLCSLRAAKEAKKAKQAAKKPAAAPAKVRAGALC